MLKERVLSIRALVFLCLLAIALVVGFYLGTRVSSPSQRVTPTSNIAAANQPEVASPVEGLSSIFTPEVLHWAPLIKAWGQAYNVDPNLVATVIQIESCGDPTAVSNSGAQGLFQVMPMHFTPGEDMQDLTINGRRGMEYLAKSLQLANGDPGLALAGYNGGHGVIAGGWARWSAETRRYYTWGTGIYKDAVTNQTSSPTLQAWLNAGGRGLCQRAQAQQAVARN